MMQRDKDFQFLTSKWTEWQDMNKNRSVKEKEKILKEMIVGVLNRFGANHWCDELACIIEQFDNYIFVH